MNAAVNAAVSSPGKAPMTEPSTARPCRGATARTASLALTLLTACAGPSALQGRIDGLREVVAAAEENGAMRCAPRELAIARANLEFAEDALGHGHTWRAEDFLVIAAPNAHAAQTLSPPERCLDPDAPPPPPEPEEAPPPQPGDRDGDGNPDDTDECPDDPEDIDAYEDTDGCPEDEDIDGDGVRASADLCPTEAEDADGRGDADGCPDPDDDFDGVPDIRDRCVIEPEDRDGFQDDDGCPDPDNDGDSILDPQDTCPDRPGPAAEGGCPRVYENVEVTETAIRITQKVHFATDRAEILPDSYALLNTVAQVLEDYPQITVEVQGHTDSRGSDRHNLRLSDARANAVRAYLLARGIDAGRLSANGYGESRPIESNGTSAGRAANRRVEFVRTDPEAQAFLDSL